MSRRVIRRQRSKIAGHGVFALRALRMGEVLDPYEPRINEVFHRVGFNHSCNPNVVLTRTQPWWLLAVITRPVKCGEELTVSYGTTPENCRCPSCKPRKHKV